VKLVSVVAALILVTGPPAALAQRSPGTQGSRNVRVLSHLPLGRIFTVSDVEVEQELSRPYAYVSRMMGYQAPEAGFDVIDLKHPAKARALFHW